MLHVVRTLSKLALVLPLLFVGAAWAQDTPSGTIQISSTKIGIGVGVQWGSGTLTLNDGSTHEFKVDGLSLVDLGVSSIDASGEVLNLKDIKEFGGSYSAPQAGAAVVKGAGITQMQNGYGVVINLKSAQEGVQFTFGPGGMELTLVN